MVKGVEDELLLELDLELLNVDCGRANGAEEDEAAPVHVGDVAEKGPQAEVRT